MDDAEIIIIGAGVCGLGVGWELVRRGHQVTLLEREFCGSGASRAAAGMLAPTAEVQFNEGELLHLGRRSLEMYPDFVAALEQASGMNVDYRTEGTLVVGLDRDDAEALEHIHHHHRELGLGAQWLTAEQARELEPGLSPNIHNAIFCPDDHQVDPRLLIDALAAAFVRAGGVLRQGVDVTEVICTGERATGVKANVEGQEQRLSAAQILVATGAWTRNLGGLARHHLPHVRPVRGQMLAVTLGEPALCRHVIRGPDAYLVPKSDGRLIIGATSEEMGFDARLTAGGVLDLLRGAWETLPAVHEAAFLEMWTGFRPVTLDNMPVLGPGELKGLWFATGHGRNGILHTPLTAHVLADAMESG